MLERYFVKPSTVDRIRGSWIAPAIEAYVGWLAEHGYSAAVVHGRVPILVRFGEFARDAGAKTLADLPLHIDAFIAWRVGERAALRSDGLTGPTLAKDLRVQIEAMLAVAVPGFERTGRRLRPQPFVAEVPVSSIIWLPSAGFDRPRSSNTGTIWTASSPTWAASVFGAWRSCRLRFCPRSLSIGPVPALLAPPA